MRVFVRGLTGETVSVSAGREDGTEARDGTLEQLHAVLEERLGVPAEQQLITTLSGKPLRHHAGTLCDQGVRPYDTLELSARLPGGQPVKVKLLTTTSKVAAGAEVTIDLEAATPMHEVKAQLAAATGLEVRHQRVMLAGIGSLVLLDKRGNIGASYCGSANSLYFATLPASEAPTDRTKGA